MNAVFLDRDGVINENRSDHVKRWEEFEFLPGALEAMAVLSEAGVPVFVISNQATVNRGMVSQDTVDTINRRMVEEVRSRGGRIDAVVYCPHRPDELCACRKPRPGMLVELAERYSLDLRDAVVIGDALTDIQAGQAVGCRTIMVMTGRGREQVSRAAQEGRNGFAVVPDLRAAVDLLYPPTVTCSQGAFAA